MEEHRVHICVPAVQIAVLGVGELHSAPRVDLLVSRLVSDVLIPLLLVALALLDQVFPLLLLLDSVGLRDLVGLRDHVHLARTVLAHLLLVALNLGLLGLKLGHLPVLLLLHQLLLKLLLLLAARRLLFARSTAWLAVSHILGWLLLRSALAKVLGLID